MPRIRSLAILFFLSLVMAVLLGACSIFPAASTPTPSPFPVLPTRTPYSSSTPTIKPSLTATAVPTSIPTSTLSPTPEAGRDFRGAKIIRHGKLEGWNYFVVIELPVPVKGSYYGLVDWNKKYTCNILPKHPNQLLCFGQMTASDNWSLVAIYEENGSKTPVFRQQLFIPLE